MLHRACRAVCTVAVATVISIALAVPVSAQPDLSGEAERIALLTGPGSINATDARFNIYGTDIGTMWRNEQGRVLAAFGDTFGPNRSDWRSNTLARSSDATLADGMSFDGFVTDRPGHAKELVPSRKIDNVEMATIPTGGVNVAGRDHMAYMSVKHFGSAGRWTTNHSAIAYSDDGGQNWVTAPGTRRPNTAGFDDPFQMVSYVRRDGYVYMFGTPNGRFGDARVARVAENALLDRGAYEYWTGPSGWQPGNGRDATPIIPGPVGELSVQYNESLQAWVMMYLDESAGAITMRVGATPTGPWSPEFVVATGQAFPSLYGGYIHPASDGQDIYFTMSEFRSYNVSLMKVRLPFNLVATVTNQIPPEPPGSLIPDLP
ncbi:MAG: DUF4185 domain-containing protein [Pseudonocardiaceae bacterium]|nr:DUF4185 domain-containing protein [Pseudonocardiaceae bacterium]